eukprot:5364041-Pleurochrysis_carterae.AAC.1
MEVRRASLKESRSAIFVVTAPVRLRHSLSHRLSLWKGGHGRATWNPQKYRLFQALSSSPESASTSATPERAAAIICVYVHDSFKARDCRLLCSK